MISSSALGDIRDADAHPPITPLDGWIASKVGSSVRPLDTCSLHAYQLERLNQTLALVQERSRFYRRLLGARPRRLSSLNELQDLPFTTADQLRDSPNDLLCVSPDEVARIVTLPTSGTTGPPKRLFFSTADQELTIDFFQHGMSTLVARGDRVAILLPGTTPGSVGALLREGLARMDVEGIVLGPVKDPLDTLLAMSEQRVNSMVGIPVQALRLARLAWTRGDISLDIDTVLLSTDYVPRALAEAVEDIWECAVFNHYGMTEMGLGGGVDCQARDGYHLREADLLFEVVEPESSSRSARSAPVPHGERGEVVFTTLTRSAMPLIRYRTGDVGSFVPGRCRCGTSLRRLAHVDARIGSTATVCGLALTQGDLDECLFRFESIVDFRAALTCTDEAPELSLTVQHCPGYEPARPMDIEDTLRAAIPSLSRDAQPSAKIGFLSTAEPHENVSTGTSKRKITYLRSGER